MMDFIDQHYSDFLKFSAANPVVAGLAGVWVMGMVTFLLKVLPLRIWALIVKHTTFNVSVDSSHLCFYDLVEWYAKKKKVEKLRTLRLTNGVHGESAEFIISVGYGSHIFFHKYWPYIISRQKLESEGTDKQKEEIFIKTIGRSQKRLIGLLHEISHLKKTEQKELLAYTYNSWGWDRSQKLKSRKLSSIILKEGLKESIVSHLDDFKKSEHWYDEMGIVHKTGIILHGPPGTGKSSLIKAIASERYLDVYTINLTTMTDKNLLEAFTSVPDECLILIEDIDGVSASLDRSKKSEEKESNVPKVTVSGLLNALDGVCSGKHIVVATTNHLDKLDPALVRPGRFDLTAELSYLDRDMFNRMLNRFFPENSEEIHSLKVDLGQMTPCTLENYVIRSGRNFGKVIELIRGS